MRQRIEVSPGHSGKRIDLFLAESLGTPRNQIQRMIGEGKVTLRDKIPRPSDRVRQGDAVTYEQEPPRKLDVSPEDIPLSILYEDSWLVVINKQRGISVHPGGGGYHGTLVNALLYHISDLSGIGGVERPGIVHRLDKDTSGAMVIAKNDAAHESLSKQFKGRKTKKEYIALVHGTPERDSGVIDAPIGRHRVHRKKMTVSSSGRNARTEWTVTERFNGYSLLLVRTFTGRTHQIRVHMTSIGFPLVGDELYGKRKNTFSFKGHVLHARLLGFHHPADGSFREFTAPLPAELEHLIETLRKEG